MISCLSVAGCLASLDLLERLAFARDELTERLPRIAGATGARGVAVLSTCQRTELYASWPGEPEDAALSAALAADRGVPLAEVLDAATTYHSDDAARHLLRVATGLESFALGETEIAAQVRAAGRASHEFGGGDAALHRLFGSAVNASRSAQRRADIAARSRSVASVGIDAVLSRFDGTLSGRHVLVVGAGEVAGLVVARTRALGARVTVCNRTRRHADRFRAAGASVVDLDSLADGLASADLAVFATAAPHPLADADAVRGARAENPATLTIVDLALPRNVDASVRDLPGIDLINLADLRAAGAVEAAELAQDLAAIEAVVAAELDRFRRWSAGRSAAEALRRLRGDAETVALDEIARAGRGLPEQARAGLARAVLRTAHRLAHGPTRELLLAAESGDTELIGLLAGLFGSACGDTHATGGRVLGLRVDGEGLQVGSGEDAAHEGSVHAAHELAM